MHIATKKIFSVSFYLLFFAQSFSLQAGWRDFFPSSLSIDTKNIKEWTIPAVSVAVLALGYVGYKYFFSPSKQPTQHKKQQLYTDPDLDVTESKKNKKQQPPVDQDYKPVIVDQQEKAKERLPESPKAPQRKPKPQPKVKDIEITKPAVVKIWQVPNVLVQTDPSSCGFHSLKNALCVLDILSFISNTLFAAMQSPCSRDSFILEDLPQLNRLQNESYFFDAIASRFKPYIMCMREKIALKEYIQQQLERYLLNKEDELYRKAIIDCSSGIAEHAIKHLETNKKFTLSSTYVVTLLHESLPLEKKHLYPIELFQKAFEISNDIVITQNTLKEALCIKYLIPILNKFGIELSIGQIENLLNTIFHKTYDSFVYSIHTIKDVDPALQKKIQPLQQKMETTDMLEPLLQETASIKRAWVMEQISKYEGLALPKHEQLLDEFIANPYIFADLQGYWLEGNELRELISQAYDLDAQKHITVIDCIDELTSTELLLEDSELHEIKKQWLTKDTFSHAFIINTASQYNPIDRGHWFTVVIHKANGKGEFIVLNSQKNNRRGWFISQDSLSLSELPCDYYEYVKALEHFFQN